MPGHRSTRDDETVKATERGSDEKLSLRIVHGQRAFSHELPRDGEVVLGRGHEADVFIDDPSVSRCHARLRVDRSRVTVEDLASANGTRIAGRALGPETPTPVRVRDAI